jgi:hypothetical protein
MDNVDIKVRQQIVEKIKSSTNILVTVSKDPSVDDLSAAIGLTALLNKIGKHATAIFSGAIPPAITFLDPGKVFENNADSLRDFIIALDKEKADHLRYKVEGDVVKIFITPYHTNITSNDLEFSQGDYNVELVLALGVASQENLDLAMSAHGQILHDVTVATFSAGEQVSRLGSLDWRDESASSLSEMVTSISDSLKSDKSLLDGQISTALLTGIVAATDRFSNTRTSSRVMVIAAQLMAAGADQQLIAAKLQELHEINPLPVSSTDEKVEIPTVADAPTQTEYDLSTLPPGSLKVSHEVDEVASVPEVKDTPIAETNVSTIAETVPPEVVAPVEISLPQPLVDEPPAESQNSTLAPAYAPEEPPKDVVSVTPNANVEPSLGETLNATAEKVAEDARRDLEDQQNKTILTHSYLSGNDDGAPSYSIPINGIGQTEDNQNVDVFAGGPAAGVARTIDLPLPPKLPDDFSTLPPPQPPIQSDSNMVPPITLAPEIISTLPTSPPSDPGQFVIPGQ